MKIHLLHESYVTLQMLLAAAFFLIISLKTDFQIVTSDAVR